MKYKNFKYNNLKLDLLDEFSKTITVSYENIQPCVFYAISDTYYRENYHSDILSYYFHFPAAKRQLIGYYNDLVAQGIKVDAIIYLNKYSIKEPDYSGWKKDEKESIRNLLIKTQLTGPGSITENVIKKIIEIDKEAPQLIGLSKELQSLFNNIINGEKIMSNEDLSKFLKFLKTKKTAENFKKLVDAYNSLPSLMRDHYKEFLEEETEKLPKIKKIGKHKNNCLYADFECKLARTNKKCTKTFYIDFWFFHDEIQIMLGTRDYDNWNNVLEALKKTMKQDWKFGDILDDDNPTISFSEVYDEEAVKKKMEEVINSFRNYIV